MGLGEGMQFLHSATNKRSILSTSLYSKRGPRILFELGAEYSISSSLVVSVENKCTSSATLSYQYRNEPNSSAAVTMHTHRGTACYTVKTTGLSVELDGEYYTGRDWQNYSAFHLQRTEKP